MLKLFVYVSVLESVLGGVLGVDGDWLPLPTRPQRYCDPTSLVFLGAITKILFGKLHLVPYLVYQDLLHIGHPSDNSWPCSPNHAINAISR